MRYRDARGFPHSGLLPGPLVACMSLDSTPSPLGRNPTHAPSEEPTACFSAPCSNKSSVDICRKVLSCGDVIGAPPSLLPGPASCAPSLGAQPISPSFAFVRSLSKPTVCFQDLEPKSMWVSQRSCAIQLELGASRDFSDPATIKRARTRRALRSPQPCPSFGFRPGWGPVDACAQAPLRTVRNLASSTVFLEDYPPALPAVRMM